MRGTRRYEKSNLSTAAPWRIPRAVCTAVAARTKKLEKLAAQCVRVRACLCVCACGVCACVLECACVCVRFIRGV